MNQFLVELLDDTREMTQEELQAKIMSMTDEQKKMHVTVCIDGVFIGINNIHLDAFKENKAPDEWLDGGTLVGYSSQ